MSSDIEIHFDEAIAAYIVRFPDWVELQALKAAKLRFEKLLAEATSNRTFSLLLDTGPHEFESIECRRYVRDFLSIEALAERCRKFANVKPKSYGLGEIVSDTEASFNTYSDAYEWLKS